MADLSYSSLLASDKILSATPPPAKYGTLAPADAVARTVEALKARNWNVIVVKTRAEALKALTTFVDASSTFYSTSSLTLNEVGWTDYSKDHPEAFKRNFKAEAAAANAKGDYATAGQLNAQGATADVFFSSISALTEEGDLYVVDATGTRVTGFLTGKKLVIIASAQKIVPTLADAIDRTNEYALALESARVRVVYGAPASRIVSAVTLSNENPFWQVPGQRNFVLVTDEVLGY